MMSWLHLVKRLFDGTGRQSGVGLGLALVRSLIGLHGGTVVLTSETGKGTTVVCRVPAGGPGSPPQAAA